MVLRYGRGIPQVVNPTGGAERHLRLLTNPDDAILNGEDRQRSKASAPRMARLEPTWMYLRRLYDLPVLSVAGTLSITSGAERHLRLLTALIN
ncbi:hypothetical protein DJ56_2964 [Yersinia pestis]|nr:hypothetical protein DJ56_2964 [Yersinia pestis]KNC57319.1 hypothetical protein M485_2073 [Yersinia pestis 14735]